MPGSRAMRPQRHPIRGGLYGLVLGVGLGLIVVGRKVVTLDSVMPLVLLVIGIGIGVLWGMYAPAKGPRGPAPSPPITVDDDSSVGSPALDDSAD